MDKYNNKAVFTSRVEKNKALYEEVKNSSIDDFDIEDNTKLVDNNSSRIDAGNLRNLIDNDYYDNAPKRKSIFIENEHDEKEKVQDTKEYDINAILKKAKEGKDINYNKERLRSVRQTQYEILNNIDLSKSDDYEKNYQKKKKVEEDNLMELINTITALELKNRESKVKEDVSEALDLFDDLNNNEEEIKAEELKKEIEKKEIVEHAKVEPKKEVVPETKVVPKKEPVKEETHEDHVTKTLSKLNIDMDSYEEFEDVVKGDKSTFILKVMIFLVVILLIIGTIFILNNMLNLGLFD
jgi:hypothetical protein